MEIPASAEDRFCIDADVTAIARKGMSMSAEGFREPADPKALVVIIIGDLIPDAAADAGCCLGAELMQLVRSCRDRTALR